ncbi:MAG: iron-sulfur cluster assembly scaffold protein [Candidatus Bathyarchaeia archaeon]
MEQEPPRPRRQFSIMDYFLYPTHVGYFEHPARAAEENIPDEALKVQFMLQLDGNVVSGARFRATTCSTLVACCERLCEVAEGKTIGEALEIQPQEIRDYFGQIPDGKANRADLAVKALRKTLA